MPTCRGPEGATVQGGEVGPIFESRGQNVGPYSALDHAECKRLPRCLLTVGRCGHHSEGHSDGLANGNTVYDALEWIELQTLW